MEYMFMPLKRFADFQGRSRRMEYWMFALAVFVISIVLTLFSGGLMLASEMDPVAALSGSLPILLFSLLLFIPSLAVIVRRFHDQDKTGWMALLALIPFIGGIIVLVFMCLEGTRGSNQYGPDPKG